MGRRSAVGPGQQRGQASKRVSASRSHQQQVWPYLLWGVSICILLASGYAVYRGDNGLIASLAKVGTFLGGLGTFIGAIVKVSEIMKPK